MKRSKATDAKVRSLKPKAGKRAEVWFEGGLGVRVGESGAKTWQTMCRIDGRLTRITLGRYPAVSVHQAGRICGRVREAIAKGEDYRPFLPNYVSPEEKEARDYLVRHLAEDYLRLYARPNKKPSSVKRDEEYIEREVLPKWGKRPASDIKRRDVALLVEAIAERGSPVAANRVHALLSKKFSWAHGTARIDANPVKDVPKPTREQNRERYLSDDEIRSMWTALDDSKVGLAPAWRLALKLALVTGQRRSEIVEAEWSEFDFDKNTWTIPGARAKNGRAHTIPLPRLALDLLEEAAKLGGKRFVFPSRNGQHEEDGQENPLIPSTLSIMFGRYRDKLGLTEKQPPPTLHDLRHTFQTGVTSLGFMRLVADKITNHVDRSMGGRYDHYDYMPEMRAAMAAWANRIVQIAYGVDTNVVALHEPVG